MKFWFNMVNLGNQMFKQYPCFGNICLNLIATNNNNIHVYPNLDKYMFCIELWNTEREGERRIHGSLINV